MTYSIMHMSVTDSIGYNCDQVALLLTTCVVSTKQLASHSIKYNNNNNDDDLLTAFDLGQPR